jgi:DNA mismatch repair protein MutS2
MIYPQNFEQKIGFDTIRQLVSGYCLSSLGKGRVEDMAFMDSLNNIKEKLEPVAEFIKMLEAGEAFPDQYFVDVRDSLKRVRLAGTYLDEQELFDLRRSLETILLVVSFVNRTSGDAEDAGELIVHAPVKIDVQGKEGQKSQTDQPQNGRLLEVQFKGFPEVPKK